ncbi:MAG: deoxyguanosinetriphosphate triphosphohydrolase family protein [Candidatus Helarchaeota archaeon]
MEDLINKIKNELEQQEKNNLSEYARKNFEGIRRRVERDDIRPRFSRDADRILHSNAFRRYIDKTQVFYLIKNDHITHRVAHVQWVSKIARFIGRVLKLNQDLIEAIALGHDIGHSPFGHLGESILDEISKKECKKRFRHNIQSVRALDKLEKRIPGDRDAQGLNLTLSVLDGILSHNGEIHETRLKPDRNKTFEILDEEIEKLYNINGNYQIKPFTLEGCLVRFVDTISYIGRDIEDAIILGFIRRDEIPDEIRSVLGNNNRDIINNLALDLIKNSRDVDEIRYSKEVGKALEKLKDFNYNRIYENPDIRNEEEKNKIKNMFNRIYYYFLKKLEMGDENSEIYKDHINLIGKKYLDNTPSEEIVIDYIAGMTDTYFLDIFKRITVPETRRLP